MKQLIFKTIRIKDGEPVLDEKDEPIFDERELLMDNGSKTMIPIQVKDFMDTETYFKISMMRDENLAKQSKEQGYYMMKELIINPKVDDVKINRLPWDQTLKIIKALRDMFLSDESFLELGVLLDKPSQVQENTDLS